MNLSLLIFICVMYVECVTFLFKPQALSAKLGITISSISSFVVLKDEIDQDTELFHHHKGAPLCYSFRDLPPRLPASPLATTHLLSVYYSFMYNLQTSARRKVLLSYGDKAD